jgi:hypothetical protein
MDIFIYFSPFSFFRSRYWVSNNEVNAYKELRYSGMTHAIKMYLQIQCILLNYVPLSKDYFFMLPLLLDKQPFAKIRLLNCPSAFLNFQSAFEFLCSNSKGNLSPSSDMMHYIYEYQRIKLQNF